MNKSKHVRHRPDSMAILAMKVKTTFYRRLFFMSFTLSRPIPSLRSRLPVSVTLMTEHDIPAYCAFRPAQNPEAIGARLTQGHRCYASWHHGEIVDASWCTDKCGPVPYFGSELCVAPGDMFVYDSYTVPSYRGYNLYMAKVTYIFTLCKAEGYARNVAVVAPENRTALTVLRRLGSQVLGQYTCLRVGFWKKIWQEPFSEEPLPQMLAPSSGGNERHV